MACRRASSHANILILTIILILRHRPRHRPRPFFLLLLLLSRWSGATVASKHHHGRDGPVTPRLEGC